MRYLVSRSWLLLLMLLLWGCGSGSSTSQQQPPLVQIPSPSAATTGADTPAGTTTAPPSNPAAVTTPVPPPGPSAPSTLVPEATVATEVAPTSSEPSGNEPEVQPNGRLRYRTMEEVTDLTGDGTPEQVVLSEWAEAGDAATRRLLQVDVLDSAGSALYSTNTWEPVGDPGTVAPGEVSLFTYDAIESAGVEALQGDALPELVVQRRISGTGQILILTIVDLTGGTATVLLEQDFYKGRATFGAGGFEMAMPLYLFGEANCCPCRISTTQYAWDGVRFASTAATRAALDPAPPECPAYPDPARWEALQAANEGPPPRRDAAMHYDSTRNRVILFGGRSGGVALDDTWAFDLTSQRWTPLATGDATRPPARFSMVAGVDETRAQVVITTGQATDGSLFDDVWRFDLATDTWQPVAASGERPVARYGAAGGIAPSGDLLLLTHGFADTRFNDTWALDLASDTWRNVTPAGELPLNRCLHAAAPTLGGTLFLFGGCSSGFGPCPQDDTWELDLRGKRWFQAGAGEHPSARQHPAMLSLPDRGELLLFGGQGEGEQDLNDLWLLDEATGRWHAAQLGSTLPTPRDGHSLTAFYTFDTDLTTPDGLRVLLFGGDSQGTEGNDLWLLALGDE